MSAGITSPGGSFDCTLFKRHRPTNGLPSAQAGPAMNNAQSPHRPMIAVSPHSDPFILLATHSNVRA